MQWKVTKLWPKSSAALLAGGRLIRRAQCWSDDAKTCSACADSHTPMRYESTHVVLPDRKCGSRPDHSS